MCVKHKSTPSGGVLLGRETFLPQMTQISQISQMRNLRHLRLIPMPCGFGCVWDIEASMGIRIHTITPSESVWRVPRCICGKKPVPKSPVMLFCIFDRRGRTRAPNPTRFAMVMHRCIHRECFGAFARYFFSFRTTVD
jgi:hypothetical protein